MVESAGGDRVPIEWSARRGRLAGMRVVSVKGLRERFAECLRIAAAGEIVFVRRGDHVIAQLGPPATRWRQSDPLEDAIRGGIVTPPTHPSDPMPRRKPVLRFATFMRGLAESREDRWNRRRV